MTETIRYTSEPSPEVLAYFRNKGTVLSFDWRDVWPQEHAYAFTVAKATQLEVLKSIQAEVDAAISKGLPFETFRENLEPRLKALGWWGQQPVIDPETGDAMIAQLGSPHRLRIIYDANVRTAFAAGLWERIQRAADTLPFLIYQETTSREPRDEHLAWSHQPVVLPVDDPWWETHFPPNGWQCKCWVLQVDEADAREAGWTPSTKAPPLELEEWFNRRTGEVEQVPKGIDPGWQSNPGRYRQRNLEEYLAGRLVYVDPALKETVLRDLNSNWLFRKLIAGDFFALGQPLRTQFAAPLGVLPPEVAAATGSKNGVVWLTPDRAFSIGANKLTEADWFKATRTIDEGAVIRQPSTVDVPNPGRFGVFTSRPAPDRFVVYREVDGQHYRVALSMQERTFDMQRLRDGARLTIEEFLPVRTQEALHEINIARARGLLLREEAAPPARVPRRPVSGGAAAAPPTADDPDPRQTGGDPNVAPLAPGGPRRFIKAKDGRRLEISHTNEKPFNNDAAGRMTSNVEIAFQGDEVGYVTLTRTPTAGGASTIHVEYVEIDSEFQRQGIISKVYDRIDAWARAEGHEFGPSNDLLDPGFAFWKARAPKHPRILSDARNYMIRLEEYAQRAYGDGVEIEVKMNGREIRFTHQVGERVLEEVTFETLVEKGVLPDVRR